MIYLHFLSSAGGDISQSTCGKTPMQALTPNDKNVDE